MSPKLDKPFFWKARDRPVHFLGSFHFGPPGGFELPQELLSIFDASPVITFEVPEPAKAPDTKVLSRESGSLRDDLSPELWSKLSSRLSGIPNLEQLKIEAVTSFLTIPLFTGRGLAHAHGIDCVLDKRARTNSQKINGLESAEDQMAALLSDCGGETLDVIARCLNDANFLPKRVTQVIEAIQSGSAEKLRILRAKTLKDGPLKMKALFMDREARWIPQIEKILTSGGETFLVLGAAHFGESDGLFAQLRKRGYKVDRV